MNIRCLRACAGQAAQKGICYIVGAAPVACLPIHPLPGDLLLAADGGAETCRQFGFLPDRIIGDLDSLDTDPQPERLIRLPVEKDETDTACAISYGTDLGFERFVICGGMGGERPDHTFANLVLIARLACGGMRGVLVGDRYAVTAIHNTGLTFDATMQGDLSVFAFGGDAQGVTLRGVKYPLEDDLLKAEIPLGVSNSFTGKEALVSVREGTLLLFFRNDRISPGEIIRLHDSQLCGLRGERQN